MNLSITINGIEYKVSNYTKQDFIDMIAVDREHTSKDLREATTELPLFIFNPTKGKGIEYLDEKVEAIISDEWDTLHDMCNEYSEDYAEACLKYAIGCSLGDAQDKYMGCYDSDEDFIREMDEDLLSDMPKHLQRYFDWKSYTADCMHDYVEYNGHYFIA